MNETSIVLDGDLLQLEGCSSRPERDPCELLEWDTRFFGRRIARVLGRRLDDRAARDVLAWCGQKRIDCLYFLADADHPETTAAAEAHGFGMKDVRLTYTRRLQSTFPLPAISRRDGVALRPARADDLPALEALTQDSYGESRFYFDQCFPRSAVRRMFQAWVRQSVLGQADLVLVLEVEGRAAGFVSCDLLGEREGQVSLTCLETGLRGRGLGAYLYDGALRWFAGQGVETVHYVTQARNVRAQRLIQRLGFLIQSVEIWYHKWFAAPGS